MTPLDPGAKRKPVLDRSGFQQLLEAAYVLQQHNDGLVAKDFQPDSGTVLTQVAQLQSLLRAEDMHFAAAAKLIAERLRTLTDSSGVSISLVSHGILHCVAESGRPANVPGNSIASNSPTATEQLKKGEVFQSADAQKDIRIDTAACRELGVQSLLTVPIHWRGQILGLVEVRWNEENAVQESHVRTSQLMAALVTAIPEQDRGLGAEPAASRPVDANDARDVVEPDADQVAEMSPKGPAETAAKFSSSDLPSDPGPPVEPLATACRVCGRPFLPHEAFCGNCSLPRIAGASSQNLQGKWASLWYMRQAEASPEELRAPAEPETESGDLRAGDGAAESDPPVLSPPESLWHLPAKRAGSAWNEPGADAAQLMLQDPILQDTTPSWDATIAALWKRGVRAVHGVGRRGKTVTAALLALLLLSVAWGSHRSPAWPHLTRFESALVKLGLAQAPRRSPAPRTGNPDLRVWVDVHTALYYCPESDLYGKTPGGEFTTQQDARQERFEPATGVVCE